MDGTNFLPEGQCLPIKIRQTRALAWDMAAAKKYADEKVAEFNLAYHIFYADEIDIKICSISLFFPTPGEKKIRNTASVIEHKQNSHPNYLTYFQRVKF